MNPIRGSQYLYIDDPISSVWMTTMRYSVATATLAKLLRSGGHFGGTLQGGHRPASRWIFSSIPRAVLQRHVQRNGQSGPIRRTEDHATSRLFPAPPKRRRSLHAFTGKPQQGYALASTTWRTSSRLLEQACRRSRQEGRALHLPLCNALRQRAWRMTASFLGVMASMAFCPKGAGQRRRSGAVHDRCSAEPVEPRRLCHP